MSQDLSSREYVALKPPLPCVSYELGGGFVHEISPRQMVVAGWDPVAEVDSLRDFTVCVSTGQKVSFENVRISREGREGHWQVDVADGQFAARLSDLLSQVRKDQHIQICATTDVEAKDKSTGFEHVGMIPCALADFSWDDLDTSVSFLGRTFAAPMFITGMTGGVEQGAMINRRLARAARALGIPMGVGSQRLALENSAHRSIFAVKDEEPDVFLIGNVGCAQIAQARGPEEALRTVEDAVAMIDADALAIHVNVLQELVQVEGDRDFSAFWTNLSAIVAAAPCPIVVKEVGVGIDPNTARKLAEVGVDAIDVGGKGGTSWSRIEGLRSSSSLTQAIAETFRDFGLPTAMALAGAKRQAPGLPVTATGGMRDGLMVAKAVGLGASMVGIGLPVFRAALASEGGAEAILGRFLHELKTAMMVTGSRQLSELSQAVRCSRAYDDMVYQWLGEKGNERG